MPTFSATSQTELTKSPLALSRTGLVEYTEALAHQRSIHSEVSQGIRPNTLILLEHPSVYTAGKRTTELEKPTDGTPVIDVDRGGKITWHGPGQLIGYPIVKLAKPTELVGFVREIEAALISVCAEFGINTQRVDGRSGVWVRDERGDRKIAAIGIRVAQGVTMHGFALNCNNSLQPYETIIACGISDAKTTTLSQLTGTEITPRKAAEVVKRKLVAVGRN